MLTVKINVQHNIVWKILYTQYGQRKLRKKTVTVKSVTLEHTNVNLLDIWKKNQIESRGQKAK